MPNIPLTNKIHTVTSGVETVNKGSAQANAGREAYTIQDLADTIGGGAVDSIVAGDNVSVSPETGTGDVTISADIGGSGTANQIAVFTADDTIGNSLLAVNTSGGINYVYVGSFAAPVNFVFGSTSRLVLERQTAAPASASTPGTAGDVVTFFNVADPADAANGLYVCTKTGVAGAAEWGKAQVISV